MNYHFFPRVPGLRTTVTLANFPPVDGAVDQARPEIAHAVWSDGTRWHSRALAEVPPGTLFRVGEDSLPESGDGLIFLFLNPEHLPEILERPPITARRDTSPAWRANIRLASATTATSFQGEYPGAMAALAKGTLLSIAPMSRAAPGCETLLLLANMRPDSAYGEARLEFLRLDDRTVVGEATARFNQLTIADLGAICGADERPVAVVSREITGIPLYLTRDPAGRHLSLEHSHPPAESVVFGERDAVQRTMKSWWLAAAEARKTALAE